MNELFGTAFASLGGGLVGAAIKIIVGFIALRSQQARERRDYELSLADKQLAVAEDFRRHPGSDYISVTRRVLAWMFGGTFCAVVLLWALYPAAVVYTAHGGTGKRSLLWGIVEWQSSAVAHPVSTGSIVWEMIPFLSMILTLYFTPNLTALARR